MDDAVGDAPLEEREHVLFGVGADRGADVFPETAEPGGLEAGGGEERAEIEREEGGEEGRGEIGEGEAHEEPGVQEGDEGGGEGHFGRRLGEGESE